MESKMTEENKELRNCPFCGKLPYQGKAGEAYPDCGCFDDVVIGDDWQNAWCWKQIDKLKSQNQRMREALEMVKKFIDCQVAFDAIPKDVYRKVEKALKEVKE